MRWSHIRFARAALIAVCFVAPVIAAHALTINDTTEPGSNNPGLDVTRHAMPPPDVTAKPAVDAPEASPPTVSANPLWAVPLSALAATRNRPLFTPSRRPPAPVIANAPPPPPPRVAPPPPPPEHPNLTLVGTVAGDNEGVAVFIDQGTRDTVRLRTGEGHLGWILQSVGSRAATLQKGDQSETLELPRPNATPATTPVISPLPPPPPPPPQAAAPPPPQLAGPPPAKPVR
jgi:hypothetical protein